MTYQQTIQGAFRDVSDGLIAWRQKSQEFRAQQELLAASAQDAAELSGNALQSRATTNYLEVLTKTKRTI